MEQIDYLKEEQCILGKLPIADAERERLTWNMIEHNAIYGLASFEYYYLNDMVCFRYDVSSYQPVSSLLKKREGDFEVIFFLCREVFLILEKSSEYLLREENFLLKPEWIFGDFFRKNLVLCYLPGRKKQNRRETLEFLEYLMEHMGHENHRSVDFIYGLYELAADIHRSSEEILDFIEHYEERQTQKEKNRIKCEDDIEKRHPGEGAEERKKGEKIWKIGREKENDICIPFMTVSREHLHLFQKGDEFSVMDLSSKNGTSLNGKRIPPMKKVRCTEKDILCLGGISFSLHMEPLEIRLHNLPVWSNKMLQALRRTVF
ncbi:MAG: FHA domain-containing protein [Lachnospiraceae bacterium]|nr:FHA domain-containing protein [Lachnospiraceae bacterium]